MTLFHQPLFNPRLIAKHLSIQPVPETHQRILQGWASAIRNLSIEKQKETEIRGAFIQKFFVELLGYTPFGNGSDAYTINDEHRIGKGAADTALGEFGNGSRRVLAPVELKGADTRDLDAIMPGRHKSAVQQVWEYAMDTPDCKFLIVSNMVEIRLYAVGHTRQVYERFLILDLADKVSEYHRFRLLLGADNFLSGYTARLLKDSAAAEKEITQKLYTDYKDWRIQLIIALAQANDRPLTELITHAQTILDRVLFIAFAEDRHLLPERVLEEAFVARNRFAPQPVWENFKGLFQAIDKGNGNDIPAYNGGLFAANPAIDALILPDDACTMFRALGAYDFASEVSVTVLGHIFEQSISDLEHLQELANTDNFSLKAIEAQVGQKSTSVHGKRKLEGVVYTPDNITSFIVQETLGRYLADKRGAILAGFLDTKQAADEDGTLRYRKPSRDEERKAGKIARDRLTEFLFWMTWRDELSQIKVVDPACGSGAFLIAAFDVLDAEYQRVNEQIQAITGNPDLFDINREILNSNLYGVDLNPESIEITKLSLWLKTAQRGKPLESLEANLKVGNSLIADMNGGGDYSTRAFDWSMVFQKIAERGGFDIVLGNPPYVRQERISGIKPYLEKNYAVYHGVADLYTYFFEQGVRLLRPGGRLGYISSSTFFKSGSGEPLRRYLLNNTHIQALVDFGDLQVFEGVTTYPAIIVTQKNLPGTTDVDVIAPIRFLTLSDAMPESLSQAFEAAHNMPQSQFDTDGWRLESKARANLRAKLTHGHPTLKEVYGSPYRGLLTGLNEAFVIDRATRDAIILDDPHSEKILKPFLEGKDLKKWRVETQDLWLILMPRGFTRNECLLKEYSEDAAWGWLQQAYPAVARWLAPFAGKAKIRGDKGDFWWELRACKYYDAFWDSKIVYVDMSDKPNFSLDAKGSVLANTGYFIPKGDFYGLGLLTSKVIWSVVTGLAPSYRGGFFRLFTQYVETLPIPVASDEVREQIAELAKTSQHAAEARRDTQIRFRRLVASRLAPGGSTAKLTNKLFDWHLLDFAAFRAEVKKQFKQDIPLADQLEWEDLFRRDQTQIEQLSTDIAHCERNIDAAVYTLFGLTNDEIALIERT